MRIAKSCVALISSLCISPVVFANDENNITVSTQSANANVVFGGVEFGNNSTTVYAGAVRAFNGDLETSGLLGRVFLAYGDYDYSTTAVAGGTVNIDAFSGDVMLGYQIVGNTSVVSAFIGADYQNNDLSPFDALNSTEGSEFGGKAQFEARTRAAAPFDASLIASYSTANDTYYSRGRVGLRLGELAIGPEISALGNDEFNGFKYGAYLSGIKINNVNFTINTGYASTNGNSDTDGFFGGIGLAILF